jgi:hypothetical protein
VRFRVEASTVANAVSDRFPRCRLHNTIQTLHLCSALASSLSIVHSYHMNPTTRLTRSRCSRTLCRTNNKFRRDTRQCKHKRAVSIRRPIVIRTQLNVEPPAALIQSLAPSCHQRKPDGRSDNRLCGECYGTCLTDPQTRSSICALHEFKKVPGIAHGGQITG